MTKQRRVLSASIWTVSVALLSVLLITGCSSQQVVPDGYWRFAPPLQARMLNNTLIKTERDHVLVLSYFGGPMLNPGKNTEQTKKRLLGNVRCGKVVSGEAGPLLHLEARFEIGSDSGGEIANATYPIVVRGDSLFVDGLLNFPEIPYVIETELSNEEALIFQQYLVACKEQ